jgi:hypothetical protein
MRFASDLVSSTAQELKLRSCTAMHTLSLSPTRSRGESGTESPHTWMARTRESVLGMFCYCFYFCYLGWIWNFYVSSSDMYVSREYFSVKIICTLLSMAVPAISSPVSLSHDTAMDTDHCYLSLWHVDGVYVLYSVVSRADTRTVSVHVFLVCPSAIRQDTTINWSKFNQYEIEM